MLSKSYNELYTAKTAEGGDDDPNNYPNPPKPNTPKGNGPNYDGDNPGGSSSSDPASRTNRGSFGNIHPNGISNSFVCLCIMINATVTCCGNIFDCCIFAGTTIFKTLDLNYFLDVWEM